jgi:hypothetical protein
MRVLAAVDKFKGTATAAQVAAAIGHACWELGHECVEQPVADGGEGTLEALGGANRTSTVTGPLGDAVQAEWRFHRGTAVIEMARASGSRWSAAPRQRCHGRHHHGHRRAHRPGTRPGREEDRRLPRRLGHHRRRARLRARHHLRRTGCVACSCWSRATCRRCSPMRPRCSPRRRAPRPRRSTCCAAGSSGWRRCTRSSTGSTCAQSARGGRRGRAGRRAGRAGRQAAARLRSRGRRGRSARSHRRRRGSRDHRRGLPRRAELRRQGVGGVQAMCAEPAGRSPRWSATVRPRCATASHIVRWWHEFGC